MELTYTVLSQENGIATVEFQNPEGQIYVRGINIPPAANGDVTSPAFLESIEAHKRAIEYKVEIGVVVFRDRNAEPVVP